MSFNFFKPSCDNNTLVIYEWRGESIFLANAPSKFDGGWVIVNLMRLQMNCILFISY